MEQKTAASAADKQGPWKIGDFHKIGVQQTLVGELLCEEIRLSAGKDVLDVACGSGNTAIAAARRNCRVTGLDIVPALVQKARERAASEGFEITLQEGNAEELPFKDASFDVVLSTFGVMFAPDQERAASELVRVCKPGGTIALATWTPESLPGRMFAVSSKHLPPPPGKPPIRWGTVPGLCELFSDRVRRVTLYDHFTYQRERNVDDWITTMRTYFGPVSAAFSRLEGENRATYERDLRQTVSSFNRATDGTLCVAMSYVNVVVER